MLNTNSERECNKTVSCDECMKDAPYHWCCELECREHEFCKECKWFENRLTLNSKYIIRKDDINA